MSKERAARPHGTWDSVISSALVAGRTISLREVALDGADVYWLEGRPSEGGRQVVVRASPGAEPADVVPAGMSARTRAHGYGGGPFTVADGIVYFANDADRRIYRIVPGGEPEPLTAEAEGVFFADLEVDRERRRLIAVRERHPVGERESRATSEPRAEPVDELVAIALDGSEEIVVLADGHDFFSAPRLSPDGRRLAWLSWDHPDMPWDQTDLWLADVAAAGTLGQPVRVAGGDGESVLQPEWSPDGHLCFVGDRTDWWNLYRVEGREIVALCPRAAEFAQPRWYFGMTCYGFRGSGRILTSLSEAGLWRLARVSEYRSLEPLASTYTAIRSVVCNRDTAAVLAASATEPWAVVRLDTADADDPDAAPSPRVLRRSTDSDIDPGFVSTPEAVEFATADGQPVHGFFYQPRNPGFRGPPGSLPPLLVIAHGGPTGATWAALSLSVQFWTSRGFAMLDVNYRGSTGYGRRYRESLYGKWGVAEVEDVAAGARHLIAEGRVDPDRVAIRGGSAGGLTVLNAVIHHPVFRAGAVYFGVSDLAALTRETHKFESRYLDRLIGPYPEAMEIYRERSPIHHVARIQTPLIFFQGREDIAVPFSQAESMVEKLREQGVETELHLYDNEGHGFRREENIISSLEAELAFYQRVFGLRK